MAHLLPSVSPFLEEPTPIIVTHSACVMLNAPCVIYSEWQQLEKCVHSTLTRVIFQVSCLMHLYPPLWNLIYSDSSPQSSIESKRDRVFLFCPPYTSKMQFLCFSISSIFLVKNMGYYTLNKCIIMRVSMCLSMSWRLERNVDANIHAFLISTVIGRQKSFSCLSFHWYWLGVWVAPTVIKIRTQR
jgi:hypothetical protein